MKTHLSAAAALIASPWFSSLMAQTPIHAALPAVSPDGRRVAFATTFGSRGDVKVMSADGTAERLITTGGFPIWFPEGNRLLVGLPPGPDSMPRLAIVGVDDGSRRELSLTNVQAQTRSVFRPSISPDGKRIAFAESRRNPDEIVLWTLNVDGSDWRRAPLPRDTREPTWGPDGRIAFVTWQFDSTRTVTATTLIVMRPDGSERREVATIPGRGNWLSWSRDSRSIALQFQVLPQPPRPTDYVPDGHVVVVDVNGGAWREIPQHGEKRYVDETPAWTPDGRLYFESDRDGLYEIYRMDADGKNERRITRKG